MYSKIALHSVPRSGSTWVGEIINSSEYVDYSYQPLFSYVFKGLITDKSTREDISSFYDGLIGNSDDFVRQTEQRSAGSLPIFKKFPKPTTVAYKEVRYHYILPNLMDADKDVKVIGLIRSPYAVINSWLKAPKEFRPDLGWNEMEEWRYAKRKNLDKQEEYNGYEKWKEVAVMFQTLRAKYPERFYLLKYEDLIKEPLQIARELFNFCGLSVTEQTEDFISQSRNNDMSKDAYSVFRNSNTDDSWTTELSPDVRAEIETDLTVSGIDYYGQ